MKRLILIVVILGCAFVAKGQNADTTVISSAINESSDEVLLDVEELPAFQGGGLSKFRDWVASRVGYPRELREQGIQGTVVLSFIIELDGKVSNVEVIQSPHPLLSVEAVGVVKNSPKWKPARQHGKDVRLKYTLPIQFKLRD